MIYGQSTGNYGQYTGNDSLRSDNSLRSESVPVHFTGKVLYNPLAQNNPLTSQVVTAPQQASSVAPKICAMLECGLMPQGPKSAKKNTLSVFGMGCIF
eukprot:gene17845-biopygen18912